MTKSEDYGIGNSGNPISAQLGGTNKQNNLQKRTLPINDGSWRRISMENDWLEGAIGYPTLYNYRFQPHSALDQRRYFNTTALGMLIMSRQYDTVKTEAERSDWLRFKPEIESVVSTAFADAISRVGSFQQDQSPTIFLESVRKCGLVPGSTQKTFCPGPPSPSPGDWTPLIFRGFTTGYAYKASRPTDYLSIAILTLYVIIALLHTLFCQVTCRTFSTCDSIESLILLAKRSEPVIGVNTSATRRSSQSPASSPGETDQVSRVDWQSKAEEREDKHSGVAVNARSGLNGLSAMSLRMRIKSMPKQAKDSGHGLSTAEQADVENAQEGVQLLLGDQEV
ncbi:MAG: hypothetical protein Q9227_006926 [Pyrenula ochraceoflavens]